MTSVNNKTRILKELAQLEKVLDSMRKTLLELQNEVEEENNDAQGDLFEYARRNSEKQAMESATYRKYLGRVE